MPSISNPELLKAAIEWKALIPRAFGKLKSLEKAIKLKIVPINSKEIVVKNISFIKLRSAEIYYKLPESCIKPLRLREFKLFAKGMDLFSIDNVNETDPEVIWSTYPAQRSVHFGFDLAF